MSKTNPSRARWFHLFSVGSTSSKAIQHAENHGEIVLKDKKKKKAVSFYLLTMSSDTF